MKNDFISTATHDLKNPVAVMMVYTEILRNHLKRQEYDDKLRTAVDQMDIQTRRMSNLIGDILDLLRLETGRGLKKGRYRLQPVQPKIP